MNYSAQKAALTRAIRSGDPQKVLAAAQKAVREWDADYWPDDWARWQCALDYSFPLGQAPSLFDL